MIYEFSCKLGVYKSQLVGCDTLFHSFEWDIFKLHVPLVTMKNLIMAQKVRVTVESRCRIIYKKKSKLTELIYETLYVLTGF